jgi:hypothetical protein
MDEASRGLVVTFTTYSLGADLWTYNTLFYEFKGLSIHPEVHLSVVKS